MAINLPVDTGEETIPLEVEEVRVVEAVSPTATAERVENGVRIAVHDLNGTTEAVIYDGENGENGDVGPVFTPSVTADGVISWTNNGDLPNPPSVNLGDTFVKEAEIPKKVSDLTDDSGHYTKPATGIPPEDLQETYLTEHQDISGKQDALIFDNVPTQNSMNPVTSGGVYAALANVQSMQFHICTSEEYDAQTGMPTIQNPDAKTFYLVPGGDAPNLFVEWVYIGNAWEQFGSATIDLSGYLTDVVVNKKSIVVDGVADIPFADSTGNYGLVKINTNSGITFNGADNSLRINFANGNAIKSGTELAKPIVPYHQKNSVFYGLAKAAGDSTQSASDNAVGTYTAEAKAAIQTMLGVPSTDDIPEVPVQDVQLNGTSIVTDGVANIPIAQMNTNNAGVVKIDTLYGLDTNSGFLRIYRARTDSIKASSGTYAPIVPASQHYSVFYGLAKAAGDSTQSASENAVGTYTDDAKTAIQTMLDVPAKSDIPEVPVQDVQVNGTSVVTDGVANVPIASDNVFGVMKIMASNGIALDTNKRAYIFSATSQIIKTGTNEIRPITPNRQHESTFYGLAKAAGDTTQSASDNVVGTYTPEAKAAIRAMLGIEGGIETVSGTTPTITGQPNMRYNCGEVSTISITPPATGSIDVIFTSGSTPTVLTVPNTVKWPGWFDATALEADTIYELVITDGVYGSVMTW